MGDHKTTKSLKYRKRRLDNDIQAILYAFALKKYVMNWNYVETVGEHITYKLHVTLVPEQVEEQFVKLVLAPAREIVLARESGKRMMEHEPTTAACGMFVGCPWRDVCKLTFRDYLVKK